MSSKAKRQNTQDFASGLESIIANCLNQNPDIFTYATIKDSQTGTVIYVAVSNSFFEDVLNNHLCMAVEIYTEENFLSVAVPDGTYGLQEPCYDYPTGDTRGPMQNYVDPLTLPDEFIRSDIALNSALELANTIKVFNKLSKSVRKYVAMKGQRVRYKDFDASAPVCTLQRVISEEGAYFEQQDTPGCIEYKVKLRK